MMNFPRKILLATSIVLSISACSTFDTIKKDADKIKATTADNVSLIEKLQRKKSRWKNVTITNNIFAPPVISEETTRPAWWYKPVSLSQSSMPFGDAVQEILADVGVNTSFGEGVKTSTTLTFQGHTIGEIIESLAGASGYSYSLPSDNKLSWSLYETKTFHIAALPGTEKFSQGQNQKVSVGSASSSDKSSISATEEYITAEGQVDILEEIYKELLAYSSFKNVEKADSSAVRDVTLPASFESTKTDDTYDTKNKPKDSNKDVLGDGEIPIFVSRATSTITVKDTPEVLKQMQKIVDIKNRKLLTQVQLDIDIVEVKLTEEAAKNWDVGAMISGLTKYGFSVSTGSAASSSNTLIGSASTDLATNVISGTVNSGRLSGSTAMIEVLRSIGTVTTRTMPSQLIRNNTIAKMRDFDNIAYILERSVTTTASVGSESTIEQDNLEVGFSLYAMPSVFENNVSIRLATNLSNLISLDKNGDTDTTTNNSESSTKTYVESPHTTHKDFLSNFAVYNGDTIVLSGLSRDSKQIVQADGVSRLLSSAQNQSSERTETLMLVTPRIVHPRIR